MRRERNLALNSQQKAKINFLVKRFKGSKSVFDIIDWLLNFKIDQYDQALKILERLEYFTENDVISLLNDRIKELIKKTKKGLALYFIPIGEFGKSSFLTAYYIKKTSAIKDLQRRNDVKFIPSEEAIKEMSVPIINYQIVFYDDFLGSGGSLIKFKKSNIDSPLFRGILKKRIEFVLCLYFTDISSVSISKSFPNIRIIGESRYKVFQTDRSIFGNRKKMQSIREFAFKLGSGLFYTKEKRKKIDHALGYKNSQALITFAHGTPNNTLPIIWSGNKKDGRDWHPLYPRQSHLRIEEAKQMRNNIALELSTLKEFGFDYVDLFRTLDNSKDYEYTFISKVNFLNYAVLKMIRRRRPIPLICMDLGITLSDYDSVVNRLRLRGILKEDNSLTKEGFNIISEIRQILSNHRNQIKQYKRPQSKTKRTLYLPQSFNGSS